MKTFKTISEKKILTLAINELLFQLQQEEDFLRRYDSADSPIAKERVIILKSQIDEISLAIQELEK